MKDYIPKLSFISLTERARDSKNGILYKPNQQDNNIMGGMHNEVIS